MCYTSHGNPILLTEEKSSSNVIMMAKVNEKKIHLKCQRDKLNAELFLYYIPYFNLSKKQV